MENEKNRPNIHYSVKKNWLNDPNGLVYLNGEYHLFYQYHPYDIVWGPMHWGHAVSKDLIKWEDLPIALYPDNNGTIFSGSAVIDKYNTTGFFDDENGLVAMYTSCKFYEGKSETLQTQSIAYSKDFGRTWSVYEGNPVIKNPGINDFRDPKVIWYEEEKKWIMVLAAHDRIYFYESTNMKNWDFVSEFGVGKGVHEGVWECPDLLMFEKGGKKIWVLKVSVQNGFYAGGSGEMYFIGEFNGKTFIEFEKNDYKWLDHGKDIYASQSYFELPKEQNRKVLIGWMTNIQYAGVVPASKNWRGMMTFPRTIEMEKREDNYVLMQKPVIELEKYKKRVADYSDISFYGENSFQIATECNTKIITLEKINASSDFTITVKNKFEQYVTLRYLYAEGKLIFNRDYSGNVDYHKLVCGNQEINTNSIEDLTIIIDNCSIELYVNNGTHVLTNNYFADEIFNQIKIESNKELKIKKITVDDIAII